MLWGAVTFCVARFWGTLVRRISTRLSKNYLEIVKTGNISAAFGKLVMKVVLREWEYIFFGTQRVMPPSNRDDFLLWPRSECRREQ